MQTYTGKDLIGKTFYCTSKYSKNLTYKIVDDYSHDWVMVHTWEGRSSSTGRPMCRVKEPYSVDSINRMIEEGILSPKKIK